MSGPSGIDHYSFEGCRVPYLTAYYEDGSVSEQCSVSYAQFLGRQYTGTRITFVTLSVLLFFVTLAQIIKFRARRVLDPHTTIHLRLLILFLLLVFRFMDPLEYDVILPMNMEVLVGDLVALVVYSLLVTTLIEWAIEIEPFFAWMLIKKAFSFDEDDDDIDIEVAQANQKKSFVWDSSLAALRMLFQVVITLLFPLPYVLYFLSALEYWQYIIVHHAVYVCANLMLGGVVIYNLRRAWKVVKFHEADAYGFVDEKQTKRLGQLRLFMSLGLLLLLVLMLIDVLVMYDMSKNHLDMNVGSPHMDVISNIFGQFEEYITEIIGIVAGVILLVKWRKPAEEGEKFDWDDDNRVFVPIKNE